MRGLRAIVPLGLYLAGAHAYSDLTGSSPAQPTLAAMRGLAVGAPEPTTAPRVKKHVKRAQGANTCGYVDGSRSQDVTCEADDSVCLYEEDASAVGCCETTSCEIWTACLDRTDSDIWSTADFSRTRYCSETASPSCAVYAYQDEVWDGYTMILCAEESTAFDFYYTADGADEDDATSFAEADDITASKSKTSSDSKETADKGEDSSGTGAGGDDDEEDDGGGTPVGAIAGGTVGGVAALGIVGAGIFFLLRRRKNKDAAAPPAQPLMGQYPNQPPPGPPGAPNQMYSNPPSMYVPPGAMPPGQPGMAPMAGGYYAPQGQDQGMAKSPLSPMSTAPSQFTPTDPSHYNPSVTGGPPPSSTSPPGNAQQTPPPGGYGYAQPAHQGQQGYPQQHPAVELPTGRPDGELRELA